MLERDIPGVLWIYLGLVVYQREASFVYWYGEIILYINESMGYLLTTFHGTRVSRQFIGKQPNPVQREMQGRQGGECFR